MNGQAQQGVWLHRAGLLGLDLDFEHDYVHETEQNDDRDHDRDAGHGWAGPGRWRLVVHEAGQLRARHVTGEVVTVDLEPGDRVVGTEHEVYVGLGRRRSPRRVKPKLGPRPDGSDRTEQGARPATAAARSRRGSGR